MKHWPAMTLAMLLLSGAALSAPARRIAVVVGNNTGAGTLPALRYAERDAERIANILSELGEMPPGDVHLLAGKSLVDLRMTLQRAGAQLAAHKTHSKGRGMLVFYFSGHSDGEGIELGPDRLGYAELKALLSETRADLRLAIIDSCNSSAILDVGGKPSSGFSIEAEDRLTTTGEAFITSSAADEKSHELSEFQGGVFTHHLLAALRGAADQSGDRLISLDEAYRYAYERTTLSIGEQHPGFGLRLNGHGELILSSLRRAKTTVSLPLEAERILVQHASQREVVADLDESAARTLALSPGRYDLQLERQGQAFSGKFVVVNGVKGTVSWDDLAPSRTSLPPKRGTPSVDGVLPTSAPGAEVQAP